MQDRRAESEPWFNIVSDPDACSGLRAQIQEAMARHHAATTQRSLQRKSKIEAFAQRTAELKKHVSDRDTEIARRGKQVAERDAELVRLRSTVTNQDAALARLHQAAKEDRTEGGDAQADRAGDAAAGTPPVPSFDR
jgi:septal ring factor EnvC (AmiA/AmiB activator)